MSNLNCDSLFLKTNLGLFKIKKAVELSETYRGVDLAITLEDELSIDGETNFLVSADKVIDRPDLIREPGSVQYVTR